jgi:hypothetical protein
MSTGLVEAAVPTRSAETAASVGGHTRDTPQWAIGAAASAALACLVRYGYTFGTGDHLVLMPRGIANADPGAFTGDWFVDSAPQPHWLFDWVTQAGETVHALPLVYLAYWLLSMVAFGVAAHWLTRRFLPGRPWAALLLGPVLVLGPEKILGSTSPLLGIALPHVLGGCLALLACAAVINRYWTASLLASLAAGLVHVQHGVNLAPVLLVGALLATGCSRRTRLALVAGAGTLVGLALVVSRWRRIESGGSEWREICRTAIPFHCDADSWTAAYLLAGTLVVGLAFGLFWAHRRDWRALLPAVALPAGGLGLAVASDLFDVPVLGPLTQTANAYRLSALVVPFAAIALLVLLLDGRKNPPLVRGALCVGAAIWALGPDASLTVNSSGELLQHAAFVVALTLALGSLQLAPPARRVGSVVALVMITMVLGFDGRYPLALGYWRGDPLVAAGLDLGKVLPEGSLVVSSPSLPFATIGRRAVVADCKRVPYGGELWREHKARVADLGGGCFGMPSRFKELSAGQVLDLARRYGGSHVLMLGDDPKVAYARANWQLVWERPMNVPGALGAGLVVFELQPGGTA